MDVLNPTRSLLVSLFFAFAVLLSGCDAGNFRYTPQAVGPVGQITVVMDSMLWQGEVGEAVRGNLSPYIGTLPAPERMFDLVNLSLASQRNFEYAKTLKNVIFVAPLSDTTSSEARFLNSVFDADSRESILSGQPAVVGRTDQWRASQQVFYIAAATPDGLVDAIERRGDDMRYAFNRITRERVTVNMFDKGRQTDQEEALMEKHDFAVNVQHDYFIAIDTTNYVWLRRVLSDTWRSLFVYYEDNANPADLTPEWIYRTRDSLTQQYMEGNVAGFVKTDFRRELNTEEINFKDRFGYETRGLWYMVDEVAPGEFQQVAAGGGPFVNYAFYDQESSRIYMIDGMVFAPSYDKREFLRHMEAIAYTFRTAQDAAGDEAQLADNR